MEDSSGDCCADSFGLDDGTAVRALKAKQPFWTGAKYNYDDPSWTDVLGLSKTLRPFRLVLSPYQATQERCRQSIKLTYCTELRQAYRGRGPPPIECVGPGAPTQICNENDSRRVTAKSLESLESVRRCEWYEPDAPRCEFLEKAKPLPKGSPTSPILYCTPRYDDLEKENATPREYSCEVRTSATAVEVGKHPTDSK
jgi:hypothetical protein